MERQIVGIIVEGDVDGNVNIITEYFDIAKETPKMLYPDFSDRRKNRSTLRYLSQLRKVELGFVQSKDMYKSEFSFQTHNVFSDEAEVQRAIDKLVARAEIEINNRFNRATGWKRNFEALKTGGSK